MKDGFEALGAIIGLVLLVFCFVACVSNFMELSVCRSDLAKAARERDIYKGYLLNMKVNVKELVDEKY